MKKSALRSLLTLSILSSCASYEVEQKHPYFYQSNGVFRDEIGKEKSCDTVKELSDYVCLHVDDLAAIKHQAVSCEDTSKPTK